MKLTDEEIDQFFERLVGNDIAYVGKRICAQAREANRLRELVQELVGKIRAGMNFMHDEHCANKQESIGMRLVIGKVEQLLREAEAALEGTDAKQE